MYSAVQLSGIESQSVSCIRSQHALKTDVQRALDQELQTQALSIADVMDT